MHVFDVVRGFSVISMVLFHLCYDLRYLQGRDLPWFEPPLQDIWRCSISWTFVFIAGCMYAWSRNNLRRAGKYLGAALVVFIVTSLVAVDVPISFGIIFCMGACTLSCWLLERLSLRPCGVYPAIALALLFLLTLNISYGSVGFGPISVAVPRALYSTPWLSWLGFPGPGFASGDYYPLLPYLFLYLAGCSMGSMWRRDGMPSWYYEVSVAPLELVGQYALPIYLIHQPLLLALTQLF